MTKDEVSRRSCRDALQNVAADLFLKRGYKEVLDYVLQPASFLPNFAAKRLSYGCHLAHSSNRSSNFPRSDFPGTKSRFGRVKM